MNKAFNVRVTGSLLFLIEMKKMQNVFCCFYYGVKRHYQQYFCYIKAISFIGGGNQSKPQTCRKSLTNFII